MRVWKQPVQRAVKYVEAGADMIFPEAITDLPMYRKFADAVKVPILANITEFGKSPLFTVDELRSANVAMVLYPLSAFRAMNKAALKVYEEIRKKGTQKGVVGRDADPRGALRRHQLPRLREKAG